MIASAVLFGTMPLFAKVAYQHGSNAYTVAFYRFALGSIALAAVVKLMSKGGFWVGFRQLWELVRLSFVYALTPVLLYSSYDTIDSGMATALHFTYPVAVMLIMAIFQHKSLQSRQILCTALCMLGLALFISPEQRMGLPGIVLAVGSGISYAVYIVLLGKSSARQLPALTMAFWIALFSAVEIGAIALLSRNLVLMTDGAGWSAHLALSILTGALALVLFQRGVLLCGEVRASLLSTFEPLTGILIGALVFGEELTPKTVAGISTILAAVILVFVPVRQRVRSGGSK